MKEIILHLGVPKTGTSAIQVFLARNRAALVAHGIDYLPIGEFGMGREGHISSGNGAYLARTLLPENAPARLADASPHRAELYAALEQSPCETGLVSSELFTDARQELLEELLITLRAKAITPRAIIYVRRQDQLLTSAYIQQVKRHGSIELPDAYVRRVYRGLAFLKYASFYHRLVALFGAGKVTVRLYGPAVCEGPRLFQDFLAALAVAPEGFATDLSEVNTSLSPNQIAIMLLINRYRPRMQFSDIVVENTAYVYPDSAGRRHHLLSCDLVQDIEGYFRDENALLAAEYFHSEQLFGPPEPFLAPQSVTGAALSFEDLVNFFGGILVRYDERLIALERRLKEVGHALRNLEVEIRARDGTGDVLAGRVSSR